MNPKEVSKPSVTERMAIELVDRLYGLTVTSIKPMVSFDDQNFRLLVSKEHKNPQIKSILEDGYTLKITNTAKSAVSGHFDSMHTAMLYVAGKGLRAPLPVPNVQGNTWKLEKLPLRSKNGKGLQEGLCGVQLLTFLPGVNVGNVSYTPDVLRQWGSLLAQFHDAVQDFECEFIRAKDIIWNLEHIPEIRNFMSGLSEEKAKLVTGVLDQYPEEIGKHLQNVPRGMIHGDFNENNILAQAVKATLQEGEPLFSVDGILDFEDFHYGTYVWDVGLMMGYALLECNNIDPLEGAGHMLSGYTSLRSLTETEMSMLKMCMQCRLCQSLVLCNYSYQLDPENDYILVTAKRGWTRLEQLCSTPNQVLLSMWEDIRKRRDTQNITL